MRAISVRRVALAAGLMFLIGIGYLLFWPVPIEPVAWQAPAAPGYSGAHARNTRLAGLRHIALGDQEGPEHIVIGPEGRLYVTTGSGSVMRMDASGAAPGLFANSGGRILGFAFDGRGRIFAADAMRGLLLIDANGKVSTAADRVGPGDPIRYANSVAVAPDGTVYFTDSTTRFAPAKWGSTLEASMLDILEQSATGRVLAFDPATHAVRMVAHGLSFANGIAIAGDGHSLFVAETGRYRIWKIDGRATGVDVASGVPEASVLIDNLPGYPDNLMRGQGGRIWVGLFRPRNPAADSLAGRPFVRKILQRLPRAWLPLGKPYGHVFAIDEAGRVVEDLQDPSGAYPGTTGATETPDRLYIHSLHAPSIGWLPRGTAATSEKPQ